MIYFDNASTTQLTEPVLEAVYKALREDYANPSSLHSEGFRAEKLMNRARRQIAAALKVSADEIYFTSGGTEANNTAVLGAARAARRRGMHLITDEIEHPSVTDSFKQLEEEGFEVTYLKTDEMGYISPEALKEAVREDTVLVSLMHVNNEVGTVRDIAALCAAVKAANPSCLFHTDCVQSFGKHPIPVCADAVTVSGHKIHAPKGVGALYIKKGSNIKSLHFGGGQEKGFRPGTENTASIIGFGLAAELAAKDMAVNRNRVKAVRDTLLRALDGLDGVYVNGDRESGSPYILNLSFEGIKGEVLLHALENEGIYIATGSACSSRIKKKKKIVDLLIDGRGENNIRLSFSELNTPEEAERTADVIKKTVPVLRRFRPR